MERYSANTPFEYQGVLGFVSFFKSANINVPSICAVDKHTLKTNNKVKSIVFSNTINFRMP